MSVWCPGCGCEVGGLLRKQFREDVKRAQRDRRDVEKMVQRLRAVIWAMEEHAMAKGDKRASVPEIYRMWSAELLGEIAERFPVDPS